MSEEIAFVSKEIKCVSHIAAVILKNTHGHVKLD